MTRNARVVVLLSAFLAGLVICFGLVFYAMQLSQRPGATQVSSVGGPFTLTDQDGKRVTDQDFKGKPFLVFFGFTHCPDICPTTLFEVSEVMRALGPEAEKTRALFITVDPERDTPAVMEDYLSSFDPHLRGLTGTPAEIDATAKAYRAYYRKVPIEGGYTMDHMATVYLMDKDGRFVAPFNLKRTPVAAAADLRRYF
jgi:protein SCO1/2